MAYQIGTRSAQTSLRLKDGETQVLAGLISDQDRSTASKVPGLGQVPIAGRLFSSNNGNSSKSEIVLSITPHIIRPQTLPEARFGDVWSGTESVVRERPLRLDPIGAARGGAGAEMPALAPTAPATGPKAGGAGGSTILNSARPPIDTPEGKPAAAAGGTAAAGTSAGAGAPAGGVGTPPVLGAAPSIGSGATEPPSPRRGNAPASIQPGRAMSPAAPSAPPGSAPPAPPVVVEQG